MSSSNGAISEALGKAALLLVDLIAERAASKVLEDLRASALLPQPELLSVAQASAYASVSSTTIRSWLSDHGLPFERLPGRGNAPGAIRIQRTDLARFVFLQAIRNQQSETDGAPEVSRATIGQGESGVERRDK